MRSIEINREWHFGLGPWMQFSLLQMVRMAAPDLPKERIIQINQKLNQIPKK